MPCTTCRWLGADGSGGSSTWRLHTAPHRASGIHDKAAAPAGLTGGARQRRQIAEAAGVEAAPLQHGLHRRFTRRRPQLQHVRHQQWRDGQQLDVIQVLASSVTHRKGTFKTARYDVVRWDVQCNILQ
jgi:hypothetical protein